jgi:hypothetical protein
MLVVVDVVATVLAGTAVVVVVREAAVGRGEDEHAVASRAQAVRASSTVRRGGAQGATTTVVARVMGVGHLFTLFQVSQKCRAATIILRPLARLSRPRCAVSRSMRGSWTALPVHSPAT